MNNFIKHLQKTFRTDTKKGRAMFIFSAYFFYWLIFYALWFPSYLDEFLGILTKALSAPVEFIKFIALAPLAYLAFLENSGSGFYAVLIIMAPVMVIFTSLFINKVVKLSKPRLIIYSIIALIFSMAYSSLYVWENFELGF